MVKQIANMLYEGGFGSPGVDIFTNFMPYDAVGILILPKMGGDAISQDTAGFRSGGFQVVTRVEDYDDSLILRVSKALTVHNLTTDNFDIKFIVPRHEPICYPVTEGNNIEYSVNFDTKYARV